MVRLAGFDIDVLGSVIGRQDGSGGDVVAVSGVAFSILSEENGGPFGVSFVVDEHSFALLLHALADGGRADRAVLYVEGFAGAFQHKTNGGTLGECLLGLVVIPPAVASSRGPSK